MGFDTSLTRKEFLGAAGGGLLLPWADGFSGDLSSLAAQEGEITEADLAVVEKLAGLSFSDEERKAALSTVKEMQGEYKTLREMEIPYEAAPAVHFQPSGRPAAYHDWDGVYVQDKYTYRNDEEIAFMTVAELSVGVRTGKITSERLTRICLDRLKKYGPHLLCVITLLEEEAMAEAKKADREIADGNYRGPLHGIPTGVKDLFAYKGHPTTWGAEPFVDRKIDYDAAVVENLREAGAIICAKLSLGALAMNDHWHKGRTRNPWNPKQGSSGSSAGSASAMAAGLLPFTIGTETLGSIISPSNRCRVTGLRPTYGAISRHGAMALSWTMDKVGPICRTAKDCMIVLAALEGADRRDPGTLWRRPRYQSPGNYALDPRSHDKVKVGYLAGSEKVAEQLKAAGIKADPVEIDGPDGSLLTGLSTESSAAFEEITRTGVVNKIQKSAWPGIFRAQRYHLAVDYVQSLRARTMLMATFEKQLKDYDVIAAPDRGSHLLLSTNLTGHPQLYLPAEKGGISLIGRLYGEPALCKVGHHLQGTLGQYRKRPDMDVIEAFDPDGS
jgi:Asp-tRNA(Asn)/Glu-tRNA(Gln) amidotransferase A subunit family amidase